MERAHLTGAVLVLVAALGAGEAAAQSAETYEMRRRLNESQQQIDRSEQQRDYQSRQRDQDLRYRMDRLDTNRRIDTNRSNLFRSTRPPLTR